MALRRRIGYRGSIGADAHIATPRDQLDRVMAVVRRVLRYWWIMAIAVVLGGGGGVALALAKKHLYRSEVVILYRERIRSEVVHGQESSVDRDEVGARLEETVLARPRLQKLIEAHKLYGDLIEARGMVAAVERMRQRIEFKAKGGDVFYMSYIGEDPEQVFKVTKELADSLIEEEQASRSEEVTATKDFLETELAAAEQELRDREIKLARFIEQNPEFARDLNIPFGVSIRVQELDSPTPQVHTSDPTLARYYRELGQLKRRKRELEKRGAQPELVRERERVQSQLREERSRLDDLRRRFTEEHPDVRATSARVSSLQAKLSRIKRRVQADLDKRRAPELRAVDRQMDELESKIDAQKSRLRREEKSEKKEKAEEKAEPESGVVKLETRWARLKREWEEARERQGVLKEKYERAAIDANSQLAAQATQMSIIDPAYKPNRPAGAPRRLIAMAGVVIGGFLGFAIALGLALVDDRIYNRRELERLEILPVMVVVPRQGGKGKKG